MARLLAQRGWVGLGIDRIGNLWGWPGLGTGTSSIMMLKVGPGFTTTPAFPVSGIVVVSLFEVSVTVIQIDR